MSTVRRLAYPPAPGLALTGALVAVILWGTSFVATKLLLREISPLPLVFARTLLGSAVLAGILMARRHPLLPPRDTWAPLALMGFVGVFLQQGIQAVALTLTSAMHAGWLIGLIPLWTAILAGLVLGERFGPLKVAGLAVGFTGAVVVVTRGNLSPSQLALPSTRGDLLILASTLNWAVYTVLGHRTLRRLGPVRATAGALLVGWLLLVPFVLFGPAGLPMASLSAQGWAALLFLGVGCSGLGYLFWYGALERVEASRVASLLYLEPLATLFAAVLILDERIHPVTVLGGLLVLAGVLLVQRAPRLRSGA